MVHLETNHIPTESKVVITTIQRLYSILRGESEFDSAEEEHSAFENEDKETKEVAYNPQIGIDTFDLSSLMNATAAFMGYGDRC